MKKNQNETILKTVNRMYENILKRIGKDGRYKNVKLLIDKDTFVKKVLKNKRFNLVYQNWVESGYNKILTPVTDRINNNGNYSLDNIQFLTSYENLIKGNKTRKFSHPVTLKIIKLRNDLILQTYKEGYNYSEIGKIFGIDRSTIKRIIDGDTFKD